MRLKTVECTTASGDYPETLLIDCGVGFQGPEREVVISNRAAADDLRMLSEIVSCCSVTNDNLALQVALHEASFLTLVYLTRRFLTQISFSGWHLPVCHVAIDNETGSTASTFRASFYQIYAMNVRSPRIWYKKPVPEKMVQCNLVQQFSGSSLEHVFHL